MKRSLRLWILVIIGLITLVLVVCGVERVETPLPEARSTSPSNDRSGKPAEYQLERDFPLALGNTWAYSGTFYEGSNPATVLTATYTVTETVVDVLHSELESYTIFQIARHEELDSCPNEWQERPENWCDRLATHDPDYYWYAVDGKTIYLQRRLEAYGLPERGIKEFVFPLAKGERWYLNVEMAEAYPDYEVDSMLRKVEQEGPRGVPAGDFETCFQMTEVVGGSWSRMWHCMGVGVVERATDHSGTPFGSREVLTGYTLSR